MNAMPEVRQPKLRPLQTTVTRIDRGLSVSSPSLLEPDVRQGVHVRAASGGQGSSGDVGGEDRAADAFFRADAAAQGLSLDEYKRKYGILIRAQDDGDRPRWEGTTTDPFERRLKRRNAGEIEYEARIVYLEDEEAA